MNQYERSEEEAATLGQEVAAKFDAGKSRWDLMPADIILEMANEDTTLKGLYDVERRISDIEAKMMFHYSNSMEAAWNWWGRVEKVPMSAGTQNPLIFSMISMVHLLDLSLIHEDGTEEDLAARNALYSLEMPNSGGFYMLPYKVLNYLGDVYLYGCEKYDDNNWRKGMRWGKFFAAFCRHAGQWHSGEILDKESGMHHIAHALWQLLALRWFEQYVTDKDDRWSNPIQYAAGA